MLLLLLLKITHQPQLTLGMAYSKIHDKTEKAKGALCLSLCLTTWKNSDMHISEKDVSTVLCALQKEIQHNNLS